MAWQVEGTDEFAGWFLDLNEDEQVDVGRVVELLVEQGPALPFPFSSGIAGSRHRHMRELRIQHRGRPYRVLTRSTHGDPPSCSLAGTRPGTTAGTTRTSQWPTNVTTTTCAS